MTQLDLNQAQCIQYANHFGYTHYVNVCSGSAIDVSWGGADWLGFAALCILGLVMLIPIILIGALFIAEELL